MKDSQTFALVPNILNHKHYSAAHKFSVAIGKYAYECILISMHTLWYNTLPFEKRGWYWDVYALY